jgi:hypothetical protein
VAAARRAEALRCAGVRLRWAVERVRLLAVERPEFERVDVDRLLLPERVRAVLLRRVVLLRLLVLRL